MALNLVSYDASGSDTDDEEMDQTPAVVVCKPQVNVICEDTSDIPKPSEAELKLVEIALREKANLKKTELLGNISLKKNGKVMIGIPSLAEVIFELNFSYDSLCLTVCLNFFS